MPAAGGGWWGNGSPGQRRRIDATLMLYTGDGRREGRGEGRRGMRERDGVKQEGRTSKENVEHHHPERSKFFCLFTTLKYGWMYSPCNASPLQRLCCKGEFQGSLLLLKTEAMVVP